MTDKRKKSHFYFCWSMLEKMIKLNRKVYDVNNWLKRNVTKQQMHTSMHLLFCFVLFTKIKKGCGTKKVYRKSTLKASVIPLFNFGK